MMSTARARRALCGGLLALTCSLGVGAVAYAEPPAAPAVGAPTTLEVAPERPEWQAGEPVVATGRLTSNGQPVANAAVTIAVDSDPGVSPTDISTGADGGWRAELPSRPEWLNNEHVLTVSFGGDDQHQPATASARFTVSAPKEPVSLVVDPVPAPVRPGQKLTLTGTLRRANNAPAAGLPVTALVDPGREAREFGTSDPAGRWTIELTVPTTSGVWSQAFPQYPLDITFPGDEGLAATTVRATLQLSEAPAAGPAPSATPSEIARARQTEPAVPPRTPQPSETPDPHSRTIRIPGGAELVVPKFLVTPAAGIIAGAIALTLLGATFISHGRGRRD